MDDTTGIVRANAYLLDTELAIRDHENRAELPSELADYLRAGCRAVAAEIITLRRTNA